MKIKLADITPSTPRVRKELNLDKLDELAASIKETGGVIVPVKLKKNGKGYTTVYGHRRIEATRIAGLKEIEAFISDVDDAELLTHALIENVVREDMQPLDVARALKQIKDEMEWTTIQVGGKFGMSGGAVSNYLAMLDTKTRDTFERSNLTHVHLKEAKAGTDSDEDTVAVLDKAADEGLSTRQTRTVAEEVTRARSFGGERAVKSVLKTPFSEMGVTEYKPTPRPKPPVQVEPKGKVKLSWVTNPNIIKLDTRLRDIGIEIQGVKAIVGYIEVNKADDSVGTKGELKQVINHAVKALNAQATRILMLEQELTEIKEELDG
jgi:ParB/RepB/Spo0J family partition protein